MLGGKNFTGACGANGKKRNSSCLISLTVAQLLQFVRILLAKNTDLSHLFLQCALWAGTVN